MLAVLALMAAAAPPASAVQPGEQLSDAKLEARARELSAGVRCLVCQNQSIDDSDAPLAKDLRLLVRERLAAGDSDEQVKAFLVARYGEFVLLRPPFGGHTLLLWLLPALVLGGAVWAAAKSLRRGRTAGSANAENVLSADEKARLQAVLDADENGN